MSQELIDKNIKKMNHLRMISDSLNYVVVAFVDKAIQEHANLKDSYYIGSENSIIVDDLFEARQFPSKETALKVISDFDLKIFPVSFLVKYELNILHKENIDLKKSLNK